MEIVGFNSPKLDEALLNDEVIAFPTETVFGLGVIYDSKRAFDNLVRVKCRTPDKPFTLMIGDKEDVSKYASIDENIKKVIDKYMPGPLTLLLKPKEDMYPWVTLGSEFIGIRVPGEPNLCAMINRVGKPLLVPSANKSGQKPALSVDEVVEIFSRDINYVVAGKVSSGKPSTIVAIDGTMLKLMRPGEIPFDEIEKTFYGKETI